MWCKFFFKHQNQLFLKSNSNKHRCRPNQDSKERILCYLEYKSGVILFQTKLWLVNPQEKRSKFYTITVWPETRATIAIFWVFNDYFSKFVGCFRPEPIEPTELIQCCRIFLHHEDYRPKYLQIENGNEFRARICAPVLEAKGNTWKTLPFTQSALRRKLNQASEKEDCQKCPNEQATQSDFAWVGQYFLSS